MYNESICNATNGRTIGGFLRLKTFNSNNAVSVCDNPVSYFISL